MNLTPDRYKPAEAVDLGPPPIEARGVSPEEQPIDIWARHVKQVRETIEELVRELRWMRSELRVERTRMSEILKAAELHDKRLDAAMKELLALRPSDWAGQPNTEERA